LLPRVVAAVVPVRDPFMPLIVASAPSEGQTDKGQNTGGTTEPKDSQEITFELVAVYQQNKNWRFYHRFRSFLEKYPFYMWRHILFKLFCSF
jgi:hypothetical protein